MGILTWPSMCIVTRASTCVTTRASTCVATRASTCVATRASSNCLLLCASTCSKARASTCVVTRASTCVITRARLLFKNMPPGGVPYVPCLPRFPQRIFQLPELVYIQLPGNVVINFQSGVLPLSYLNHAGQIIYFLLLIRSDSSYSYKISLSRAASLLEPFDAKLCIESLLNAI